MAKNPGFGNRNRRPGGNFTRVNDRIRAREIRVIGPDGKQIGLMLRDEALKFARKIGLDLVEISPQARPPVCRILDYGKFKYEQSKKNKDKAATTSRLKEVKFRVRIEQHDYMTKLRLGEKFLFKGNKLKLSLMFRGREMEHQELGIEVLKRAIEDLKHVGQADSEPRRAGRNVSLTMSPLSSTKRKLVYNASVSDEEDEDDAAHDAQEDDDMDEEVELAEEKKGSQEKESPSPAQKDTPDSFGTSIPL
jgi:translation initiation factor IF-3